MFYSHLHVCLYSTCGSHLAKHDIREEEYTISGSRSLSFPLDGFGPSLVHLVGSLMGDQQPREINKAVNTDCQRGGRKGELIFHSPREVRPIKTCQPPLKNHTNQLSWEFKEKGDRCGCLGLYKCHSCGKKKGFYVAMHQHIEPNCYNWGLCFFLKKVLVVAEKTGKYSLNRRGPARTFHYLLNIKLQAGEAKH